jgi:glycerol-3-phosphate dehydrogenase
LISFVAGVWTDIEACHYLFQPDGTPKTVKKSSFPRSQSFSSRARLPPDGVWDVVIIGAGCIGACVARELSKSQLYVLLLDSADDVTQGATKGNSGIVHAGYDDKPGTNRAKYCWRGNQMFAALDDDLHFGFQRNGSLVIAVNDKEEAELQTLLQRGATNGVKNLRIITREEVSAPA